MLKARIILALSVARTFASSPRRSPWVMAKEKAALLSAVFSKVSGEKSVSSKVITILSGRVATFTNPEGLVGLGDNTFNVGVNSGEAVVLAPQTLGAGRIEAGQLEQSNVDLSREFIGLITASTGFSAAGRVVRTADDLLQELLLLVR